jgi:hypothetical protein
MVSSTFKQRCQCAAVRLGISQLSEQDVVELNEVRKCAGHGGHHAVIDDRTDCGRLIRALEIARTAIRSRFVASRVEGKHLGVPRTRNGPDVRSYANCRSSTRARSPTGAKSSAHRLTTFPTVR